jgi:cell division septation protein DedD
MQRSAILGLALAAVFISLALAAPAAALSVDQVIALKRAGVSEETIRKMIQTEIKVRSMGGVGSYTVKQQGGDEWVVYQAATPQGVVDYPWDSGQYYPAANMGQVAAVLNPKRSSAPQSKAKSKSASKSGKSSSAKGYTLHLSSYQKQAGATQEVAKLAKQGVQARVESVDLGGKGRWHRVLVGKFSSKDQARSQGQRLAASGSIASFRVMPR